MVILKHFSSFVSKMTAFQLMLATTFNQMALQIMTGDLDTAK